MATPQLDLDLAVLLQLFEASEVVLHGVIIFNQKFDVLLLHGLHFTEQSELLVAGPVAPASLLGDRVVVLREKLVLVNLQVRAGTLHYLVVKSTAGRAVQLDLLVVLRVDDLISV